MQGLAPHESLQSATPSQNTVWSAAGNASIATSRATTAEMSAFVKKLSVRFAHTSMGLKVFTRLTVVRASIAAITWVSNIATKAA
jgi:hypothetical protein